MPIFHPLSDVHTEFSSFVVPQGKNEEQTTLLLCGDIGVCKSPKSLVDFLNDCSGRFGHIFYIPGNHEYYGGGSLLRVDDKLEEICQGFSNVTYLNNKCVEHDGVVVMGTTLWTDMDRNNPLAIMDATNTMNDYKYIRTGTVLEPYRRPIRPTDTLELNHASRVFLHNNLQAAHNAGKPAVVMTHHAPLPHLKDRNDGWMYYYNTGLEDLILDFAPRVWAHGHTHKHCDEVFGQTRFLCNTRDYSYVAGGYNGQTYKRGLLVSA